MIWTEGTGEEENQRECTKEAAIERRKYADRERGELKWRHG